MVVKVEAKNDKVIFSIKDTGIGFPSKQKAALFEKFSRGKDSVRVYTGGAGLGLYLNRKFIEAHHGRIWAESKGEDKGATFFFELPIEGEKI